MRPKDYAFATAFETKDRPLLYKLARMIKTSVTLDDKLGILHNPILSDNYHAACQKKWDDHHNSVLQIGNKTIQIVQTSKADDLVTNPGLDQCIDLMRGASSVRFIWMGKGTGLAAPLVSQTTLSSEIVPRLDMTTFAGWIDPGSKSLGFGAIFGETHQNMTVTEQAIFTASSGGIMLNRNMFSNLPLSHTVNVQPFVLSSVMEAIPKV